MTPYLIASAAALLAFSIPGRNAVPVCGLITRAEAAAAAGKPVPVGREHVMDLPEPGHVVHMEICKYGDIVMVSRFTLGSDAPAYFHRYQRGAAEDNDDLQNVPGLGDEAFSVGGQLSVRKGSIGLMVDVNQNLGGGAPERAAEKRLALLALGRL